MERLQRVVGEECPECSCPDCTQIGQYERWGSPILKMRCEHCGFVFMRPAAKPANGEGEISKPNVVVYTKPKCPNCESKNSRVTSSRVRHQYRKCRDCGQNFQSVEVDNLQAAGLVVRRI